VVAGSRGEGVDLVLGHRVPVEWPRWVPAAARRSSTPWKTFM
jgi:hypothetical protein